MKKLDEKTKIKLIYSGELMVFAIVFLVIGILQITGVIEIKERFLNLFKFLTLIGGIYLLVDFVICLTNKQRREKVSMVDKFSTIIIPPYTITIDILLFAKNENVWNNPRFFIAPLFMVIAIIYAFQAIYHWFYPLKALFEDDDKKEDDEKVVDTQEAVIVEEQIIDDTKEN